jgi:N,N'-diacetyllegionaminate synthase
MTAKLSSPPPLHIIAEAGSNHNGDAGLAKGLVAAAASAGADSVKFQFINPELLYLETYWRGGEKVPNPVFQQRSRERLEEADWAAVFQHAHQLGLPCSASIFDERGLETLKRLNPPYVKIASTDLNNIPLVRRVAASGIRTFMSTGMSTLAEIETSVEAYSRDGDLGNLTLLHCVSQYPCSLADARLYMLEVLRAAFGLPVGYSDHTLGSEASVAAVALGAVVIEKHFTLDRSMKGFDHAHALEPDALRTLIEVLRDTRQACARSLRKVSEAEEETRVRARRGVYAGRDLRPGDVLREEDLLVVRPRADLAPCDVDRLLGMRVATPILAGEPLRLTSEVESGGETWGAADRYWRGEMRAKGIAEGTAPSEGPERPGNP